MTTMGSVSRVLTVLAVTLPLVVGCGSDGPIEAGPEVGRDAGDVEAPRDVRATTDDPARVRVTWSPSPGPGVTAYVVYRDGGELARVAGTATSYDDTGAGAAALAPPLDVTASDGTSEAGVTVTWKPSGVDGKASSHAYTVAAVRGESTSRASEPATGSRSAEVTDYEVALDEGATWKSAGLKLTYEDADAPRAAVGLGAPQVTPDDARSALRLELPAEPTVGAMPSRTYRVRARAGHVASDASAPATGKRAVGRLELLAIQWQRSSGTTDGGYSDLPNVTGRVWFDATSSVTEPRYFRARASSPWAEGVSSAASAQPTVYASVAAGASHTCGVRAADGKVVCWGYNGNGQAPAGPSAEAFTSVTAGGSHTCGVRASDGNVLCWGRNIEGQAPAGPSAEAFTSVTAGGVHTCGVRASDGKVLCWGQSDYGQAPRP